MKLGIPSSTSREEFPTRYKTEFELLGFVVTKHKILEKIKRGKIGEKAKKSNRSSQISFLGYKDKNLFTATVLHSFFVIPSQWCLMRSRQETDESQLRMKSWWFSYCLVSRPLYFGKKKKDPQNLFVYAGY